MNELKQEKQLKHFDEHCQNIGVQIHKAVKERKTFYVSKVSPNERHLDLFMKWALHNDEVREAVKALVNHSLKMMDK